MTKRTAITVQRPLEEVRSLLGDPDWIRAHDAEVASATRRATAGTEIHVDLERAARRQARRGRPEAHGRRAAGEGQGRAAALQAARRDGRDRRARTARPRASARERKLKQRPAQPLDDAELEKAGVR